MFSLREIVIERIHPSELQKLFMSFSNSVGMVCTPLWKRNNSNRIRLIGGPNDRSVVISYSPEFNQT